MRNRRNPGAIEYFHRNIENFDSIYKSGRRGAKSFLNNKLRASVRRRFNLAFQLIEDIRGKTVLDIGCGTGRYMFEAISRGARQTVGIDAAGSAIEAARRMAANLEIKDKAQFIETDFVDFNINKKFDIVFAVGYFDYILSPELHLSKMLDFQGEMLFASFPKLWHPMTPIRKFRLFLNRCPVRFYSRSRIAHLMETAGFVDYEVRSVARDYILVVRKARAFNLETPPIASDNESESEDES